MVCPRSLRVGGTFWTRLFGGSIFGKAGLGLGNCGPVVCPLVEFDGAFRSVGPGGWWVFAAGRWLGSVDSRYGGLLFSLRLFSMMGIDSNPLFSGENDAEGLLS